MWSSLAVEGKRTMPQNQILDNLVTTLSNVDLPEKILHKHMASAGTFCYLRRRLTLWQKTTAHSNGKKSVIIGTI